jgi:hypothetical protein
VVKGLFELFVMSVLVHSEGRRGCTDGCCLDFGDVAFWSDKAGREDEATKDKWPGHLLVVIQLPCTFPSPRN